MTQSIFKFFNLNFLRLNEKRCLLLSGISTLDKNEQQLFLNEYRLEEAGLNKVIRSGFDLLGLHTFFTCGSKEVKSWTIQKGMNAPQAAGQIHSDFKRGFIKFC